MKKVMKKVISYKNLPARWPLGPTATLYLLLDRFSAPQWLWATLGTLMALLWIGMLASWWQQREVDLFEVVTKE